MTGREPFQHPERKLSDTRKGGFPTSGREAFRHPEGNPYDTHKGSLTTPVKK